MVGHIYTARILKKKKCLSKVRLLHDVSYLHVTYEVFLIIYKFG